MYKKHFQKNWLSIIELIFMTILVVITNFVLIKELGKETYGILNLVSSFTFVFMPLAVLVKQQPISLIKKDISELYTNGMIVNLVSSLLIYIFTICLGFFIYPQYIDFIAIGALAYFSNAGVFLDIFYILQKKGNFIAMVKFFLVILSSLTKLSIVFFKLPFELIFYSFILDGLAFTLTYYFFLKNIKFDIKKIKKQTMIKIIKSSLPISTEQFLGTINLLNLITIIPIFIGIKFVGIYVFLSRILSLTDRIIKKFTLIVFTFVKDKIFAYKKLKFLIFKYVFFIFIGYLLIINISSLFFNVKELFFYFNILSGVLILKGVTNYIIEKRILEKNNKSLYKVSYVQVVMIPISIGLVYFFKEWGVIFYFYLIEVFKLSALLLK